MIPHTPDMSIPQHIGTAAMNTISGAGNAITQTLAHPIDSAMNVGKLAIDPILATFSPKDSISQQLGHSLKENPAQTIENLLGGYLAGKGIGLVGKGASAAGESIARTPTQWSAEAATDQPWNNLASKIGPTGASQQTMGVLPKLSENLKAIVPQMGPTGARTPLEFSKAVDHFRANTAVPEYANVRDPIANEPISATQNPTNAISPRVQNYIVPSTGNPLGPNPSIAEAEQALNNLNEATGKSYQMSANSFDPETLMSKRAMAAELRSVLNQRIGQLSGLPNELIGSLRQRMGQAGNIAENAQQRGLANMTGVDPASAAAGGNTARSMGARALRSTLLEPIENWQFRRALSAVDNPPSSPSTAQSVAGNTLKVVGGGMQAIAPLTPVQSMAQYIRSLPSKQTTLSPKLADILERTGR
jgi:hypothetical protein